MCRAFVLRRNGGHSVPGGDAAGVTCPMVAPPWAGTAEGARKANRAFAGMGAAVLAERAAWGSEAGATKGSARQPCHTNGPGC